MSEQEQAVTERGDTAPIKSETVLVLRCVKNDMTSRHNDLVQPGEPGSEVFKYPESGYVEAPDWDPVPECGYGLHGWLWGAGDILNCSYWDDATLDAHHKNKWLVIEVEKTQVLERGGKCKFRCGYVTYCGSREEAVKRLSERAPAGTAIMFTSATAGYGGSATAGYGGSATAGYGGSATAGYGGSATAGHRGSATAGHRGSATAGDGGSATAGDGGSATAGYGGSATAGDGGSATAGDGGSATAGYGGSATAGYGGSATAGHRGSATAGYGGSATAGYGGSATAGYGGSISIQWYDEKRHCYRRAVAEIDKNGEFKPGVAYVVDASGRIVQKENA